MLLATRFHRAFAELRGEYAHMSGDSTSPKQGKSDRNGVDLLLGAPGAGTQARGSL